MAVKEKKSINQPEEEPVLTTLDSQAEMPAEPTVAETPVSLRQPCLGDMVLYWNKERGTLSDLKGFVGFVVAKLPMHDEFNLAVFLPTGGMTFHPGRKQASVPEIGRFTLIEK